MNEKSNLKRTPKRRLPLKIVPAIFGVIIIAIGTFFGVQFFTKTGVFAYQAS